MKCNGFDIATREPIQLTFGELTTGVDPVLDPGSSEADVFVAPGWIDLQVNGFAGVDYNSPGAPHEEIARSLRAMFATGVTRCFPTVITGSPGDMAGALRNLAAAKESLEEGPAMEAFHVEGPHISPEDGPRGAHPQRWVRPPDLDEFRRFQEAARGNIRIVTLSPEWDEAPRYIEALARDGIVLSIGHTKATAAQIQDAVSAGASMSTHIGNGAHAVLPRHPNYIWEQLAEDRLTAGFIADGIHLSQSFFKAALRAKGTERAFLVTDAVMPAGCEPGPYTLGEVDVELHADGSVRLRGGTRLAGSALLEHRAIANAIRLGGITLTEAVTMATRNPARAGRIGSRQRGLVPGDRADLVRFRYDPATHDISILETYLSGRRVFPAN